MNPLNKYSTNSILLDTPLYCCMLGLTPSLGARSPILWNRFFECNHIHCRMYPVDIPNDLSIRKLLDDLSDDPNFLGAAVAAPYKTTVFESTSVTVDDPSAQSSCSVNNIFRSKDGRLMGANTDAHAAIYTIMPFLKMYSQLLNEKPRVLCLGLGATGRAIASLLSEYSHVTAWNRSSSSIVDSFAAEYNIDLLKVLPSDISSFSLVINSTTVGSDQFSNASNYLLDSLVISTLGHPSLYFEVNYSPAVTRQANLFIDSGFPYINGILMNRMQAAIAISNCFVDFDSSTVLDMIRNDS